MIPTKLLILALILGVFLVNAGVVQIEANANDSSQKGKKIGVDKTFDDFKKQFGKMFSTSEETKRKENFGRNIAKLVKSDCWPCGVTQMFDRSPEELDALNGLLPGQSREFQITDDAPLPSASTPGANSRLLATIPTAFDWRTYGVVTPIRNQANCGSCWAFSATAFLESEGIRRKKFTNTIDLAEHYLLQCTANGTYKCNGGDPFKATVKGITPGMPLESTYPYRIGFDYASTICTAPIIGSTFTTTGQVIYYYSATIKSSDSTIISYLLQRPLILGVNANDWFSYAPAATATADQKIMYCSTANSAGGINHAVLLVGYTAKAWLIKNSWGTTWGDKGYIWVTRDPTRNCGIGNYWGTVNSTLTPVV